MGSENRQIVKLDWNSAEFFFPEELDSILYEYGALGKSLVGKLEELSLKTDDFLSAYLDYDEYYDSMVQIASDLANLLSSETNADRRKEAANKVGHSLLYYPDRRLHLDSNWSRPQKKGLHEGFRQFALKLNQSLNNEIPNLKRIGIEAKRNLERLGVKFQSGPPSIIEVHLDDMRGSEAKNQPTYSINPIPAVRSFALAQITNDLTRLTDAFNSLLKSHINTDTQLPIFKALFQNKKLDQKVTWKGTNGSLKYFIARLESQGIIKTPNEDLMEKALNCFYIPKYEGQPIKKVRRAILNAIDSQTKEIDVVIEHLAAGTTGFKRKRTDIEK